MSAASMTDPELVRALFRHLDQVEARYLVLRNHDGYPHRLLKPDIGLLVAPDDAGLLVEAVEGACRERRCDWSLRAGARNNVVLDIHEPAGARLKIDARTYESIPLRPSHRVVPGLSYKVFWDEVRTRRVRRDGCSFNAYAQPDALVLLMNQWRRKRDPRYQREICAALQDPATARWFSEATGGVTPAAIEASQGFHPWHEEVLRRLVEARWGREDPRRMLRSHARALGLLLRRLRPSLPPLVYLAGPDGSGKTTLAEELARTLDERRVPHRRLYSLRWMLRGCTRQALRAVHAARGLPRERFETAWQGLEQGVVPPSAPGWRALKRMRLLADLADVTLGSLRAQLLRLSGRVVVVETSPYDAFVKYGMPEFPGLERLLGPLIARPTLLLLLRADAQAIATRKPELSADEVEGYYRRLERVLDRSGAAGRVREVDTSEPPADAARPARQQVVDALAAARRRALPRALPRALAGTPCPGALLHALHAEEDDVELLKSEPGRKVVRVRRRGADPVIAKWWARDDLKGRIRTRTATASWDHEWQNLRALHEAGVPVPRPVGLLRVEEAGVSVHAVLMEDLGRCTVALDHVKHLARTDDQALRAFDVELIELTRRVLEAGFVDSDHRLNNIVVDAEGRPLRLDVELARRAYPGLATRVRGQMLGRLVATYAFAVQPAVALAERFAAELARRLEPSAGTRWVAGRTVQAMLAQQREGRGIDTVMRLPW